MKCNYDLFHLKLLGGSFMKLWNNIFYKLEYIEDLESSADNLILTLTLIVSHIIVWVVFEVSFLFYFV